MSHGGTRTWTNRDIHLRHISDAGAMVSARKRVKAAASNCNPLIKQLYQVYVEEATGDFEGTSRRSGVSRAAVRRWAKGERDPKLSLVMAVADVLGFDVVLQPKRKV